METFFSVNFVMLFILASVVLSTLEHYTRLPTTSYRFYSSHFLSASGVDPEILLDIEEVEDIEPDLSLVGSVGLCLGGEFFVVDASGKWYTAGNHHNDGWGYHCLVGFVISNDSRFFLVGANGKKRSLGVHPNLRWWLDIFGTLVILPDNEPRKGLIEVTEDGKEVPYKLTN